MRISQYYHLPHSQPALDFVDTDVKGDVRVFVDPQALRMLGTEWGHQCVSLVQNFFHTVLRLIGEGQDEAARRLLRGLREPNETHLGLSHGRARGRGIGHQSAHDVWDALSKSAAVKSGLLVDLEDTILMVERIGADIVSDMTTNIIRAPLIAYTQETCKQVGIELVSGIPSGPLWDAENTRWDEEYVSLPMSRHGKVLLVPKVIVRCKMDYDCEEYYNHYIIPYLQQAELRAGSALVQLLKNGTRRVTRKSIVEKYGKGKSVIAEISRESPEVLEEYRNVKRKAPQAPLEHEDFAVVMEGEDPAWDTILSQVLECRPGPEDADKYNRAVAALLHTLLYPNLDNPRIEFPLHEGRKRVDITYCNNATYGFFEWVAKHYPVPYVFVECKNYTGEPGNPELDQLAGRFSPSRGQLGLLVCRTLAGRKRFMKRCRDTVRDQRGFIVPLDDDDLRSLIELRKMGQRKKMTNFLMEKFRYIVS